MRFYFGSPDTGDYLQTNPFRDEYEALLLDAALLRDLDKVNWLVNHNVDV